MRGRILYITDGGPGGVSSHVRCLAQCIKDVADVMVCITYRSEALKKMLDEDETPYLWCRCKNGHDWRLLFKVRKLIRDFRPDVIHFHDIPLLVALYVKILKNVRVFCSLHTPSSRKVCFSRNVLNLAVRPCYFLPVSGPTWEVFQSAYPWAKGEVFFNPIRLSDIPDYKANMERRIDELAHGKNRHSDFVVGMVGRNADQKDWPSFCSVANEVMSRAGDERRNDKLLFCGVGVSDVEAKGFGAGSEQVQWKGLQPNGREWIGKLDLFVLTSKHEQLPTTVLECFAMGTPVCGFVPVGGMSDILNLSSGPLREAFMIERDCEKLSAIIMNLIVRPERRLALVEDGRKILENHFDAERNCRGRLMTIYKLGVRS